MDPTECLELIRELAKKIVDRGGEEVPISADDLAERILDLDHWISVGGFLPDQWTQTKGE